MSDTTETKTVPAGSPVTINVAAPAKTEKVAEPEQLAEAKRARREQREAAARAEGANEILKELGVKKSDRARMIEQIKDGRVKLAEVREELEAAKKASTEAKAEVDAFKPYKDQVEQLSNTLKKYADLEFAALPEPFQKALADMKLEDPKARLDMIEVWKKNGIITPAQAKEAVKEVKEAPKPAPIPSNTMATAPSVTSPAGPTMNHYEVWQQLSSSGQHFLAAQYFDAHSRKILEQRPK